jgi:hypothetical protein
MEVSTMKEVGVIFTLLIVVFSQGCCSIFTSAPQTISVDSKPAGAKVKIGPYKGVAPYQVSIPRGKDYVIEASLDGKTQTLTLNKSIQPLYWVNILIWPGLIIDLATGTMFRYDPTEYQFDFTQ